MWLPLILSSALVLSAYDLAKKQSVRNNDVFPVLLLSTASGWLSLCVWLAANHQLGSAVAVDGHTLGLLLLKSLIVAGSWTATYFALRILPISVVAPIRATGPLWTLLGALLIYLERPTAMQFLGIALALVGCWLFSLAGKREGLSFFRNRFIGLAFLGAFLGSCSALYDKCLLQKLSIPTETVLFWFLLGMTALYGVAVLFHRGGKPTAPRFEWRWTIPLVGILLVLSDGLYFSALHDPDAAISILSVLRRSSVVVTFLVGGAVFHETNLRRKGIALACILAGVLVLCVWK